MVHTRRPLQEKMALFWHNHFGIGYSKVAAVVGAIVGTKMMANKPGDQPGPQGHYELLRQMASRKIPRPADRGRARPRDAGLPRRPHEHQERAAGELRPRGAWSSSRGGLATTSNPTSTPRRACSPGGTSANVPGGYGGNDPTSYQEFVYNAAQHDTGGKDLLVPDHTAVPIPFPPAAAAGHAGRHRSS